MSFRTLVPTAYFQFKDPSYNDSRGGSALTPSGTVNIVIDSHEENGVNFPIGGDGYLESGLESRYSIGSASYYLSGWFKADQTPNVNWFGDLLAIHHPDELGMAIMGNGSYTLFAQVWSQGGSEYSTVSIPMVSINDWVFIEVAYDAALKKVKFAINGGAWAIASGALTNHPSLATQQLLIGKPYTTSSFLGSVDEVFALKGDIPTDAQRLELASGESYEGWVSNNLEYIKQVKITH